ncbi:hypothetical protein ABBQ38_001924 [Trebouxia sp. C0009 RCD-2024]
MSGKRVLGLALAKALVAPNAVVKSITRRVPLLLRLILPELAEWDHERTEAEGFYPHTITLGSHKLVHWICSRCPRGQPHHWTAMPASCISNGSGCGVCAGMQACVCNSLESLVPSVAADFDLNKNDFAPLDVTAWSQKEVWWINAKRGSWKQVVHVRTYKHSRSNPEQARC